MSSSQRHGDGNDDESMASGNGKKLESYSRREKKLMKQLRKLDEAIDEGAEVLEKCVGLDQEAEEDELEAESDDAKDDEMEETSPRVSSNDNDDGHNDYEIWMTEARAMKRRVITRVKRITGQSTLGDQSNVRGDIEGIYSILDIESSVVTPSGRSKLV